MAQSESVIERFESKFDKVDGCWQWKMSTYPKGYGTFKDPVRKCMIRAHRFSYELYVGPIPDGVIVCHKCDNRGCVNPDHLFLGTQYDNMQDMVQKNRVKSKLTLDQVKEIRLDERNQYVIAEEYQISQAQVSNIKRGKTWQTRLAANPV